MWLSVSPGSEVCSQQKDLETVKNYGKPSIHRVDALKNTGAIRKKIQDVDFIFHSAVRHKPS